MLDLTPTPSPFASAPNAFLTLPQHELLTGSNFQSPAANTEAFLCRSLSRGSLSAPGCPRGTDIGGSLPATPARSCVETAPQSQRRVCREREVVAGAASVQACTESTGF